MWPDWLESLLTSCPRYLRKMGYLRELFGIRRCLDLWGAIWEPHFEKTRAVIRTAMSHCSTHRKAVILGSGWLNDVPLADLAAAFRAVILVDAVHPFSIRRRVRRWPNVSLLAVDITGVAEAVYLCARKPGPLPRHAPDLFCADPEVDFVASVNLLSQLPYWPQQYLHRAGVHAAAAIDDCARDIVRAHLDYLRRLPGVVALIADIEEMTITAAGKEAKRISTVYGVELPKSGETWTWPLVPRLKAYPHHGLHRLVVGITDLKQCSEFTSSTHTV